MKRKSCVFILVTIFFFSLGLLSACFQPKPQAFVTTDEVGEDGFGYNLLEDGSYGVAIGNHTDSEEITIPSEYKGKPVSEIVDGGFHNAKKLRSVDIPVGIKTIGAHAFGNCANLKEIQIPEGVTVIRPLAFSTCVSLESVTFPESLT